MFEPGTENSAKTATLERIVSGIAEIHKVAQGVVVLDKDAVEQIASRMRYDTNQNLCNQVRPVVAGAHEEGGAARLLALLKVLEERSVQLNPGNPIE